MVFIPILKSLLTISDLALLYFLLSLMLNQYFNNYSLQSWASIFHILCSFWLTLRGLFWVLTILIEDPSYEVYLKILYWIPCPFEYAAFLLLPLFFAQVLYPREWRDLSQYIFPAYTTMFAVMMLVVIVWVYITVESYSSGGESHYCIYVEDDDSSDICSRLEYASLIFRWFTAICFLLLATLQGIYAFKLYQLDPQQYMRFLITSPDLICALNIVLIISFSSRGFYQIFAIFKICELPSIPLLGSSDIGPLIFICFEIWYVVPTFLLITTLTGKSVGSGIRSESFEITYGSNDRNTPVNTPATEFFANSRYSRIESIETEEAKTDFINNALLSIKNEVSSPEHRTRDSSSNNALSSSSSSNLMPIPITNSRSASRDIYSKSYDERVDRMNIHGIDRFETPLTLTPSSTWLVGLTGSVFDKKPPSELAIMGTTPTSVNKIIAASSPSKLDRSAEEIEYYSRRIRGNSIHDVENLASSPFKGTSGTSPYPTSQIKSSNSSSSLYSYRQNR